MIIDLKQALGLSNNMVAGSSVSELMVGGGGGGGELVALVVNEWK